MHEKQSNTQWQQQRRDTSRTRSGHGTACGSAAALATYTPAAVVAMEILVPSLEIWAERKLPSLAAVLLSYTKRPDQTTEHSVSDAVQRQQT